jgi:hypothetical protein
MMRVPFIARTPYPAGDQNRELIEITRQARIEPEVFADFLQTIAKLR